MNVKSAEKILLFCLHLTVSLRHKICLVLAKTEAFLACGGTVTAVKTDLPCAGLASLAEKYPGYEDQGARLEQIYGYQYTGIMNEPGYRYNLGGEETEEFYRDYMAYLDSHLGNHA